MAGIPSQQLPSHGFGKTSGPNTVLSIVLWLWTSYPPTLRQVQTLFTYLVEPTAFVFKLKSAVMTRLGVSMAAGKEKRSANIYG